MRPAACFCVATCRLAVIAGVPVSSRAGGVALALLMILRGQACAALLQYLIEGSGAEGDAWPGSESGVILHLGNKMPATGQRLRALCRNTRGFTLSRSSDTRSSTQQRWFKVHNASSRQGVIRLGARCYHRISRLTPL